MPGYDDMERPSNEVIGFMWDIWFAQRAFRDTNSTLFGMHEDRDEKVGSRGGG
jgi:hypothetical protein